MKIIIFFSIALLAFAGSARACPACSNPSVQGRERIRSGEGNHWHKGDATINLNYSYGFDYEGGHPETKGIAADGSLIKISEHEHFISLDFWRMELAGEWVFAKNWALWARLPYDEKTQKAEILLNGDHHDHDSAARNRDIHHRNARYTGFSDASLLVAKRLPNFLGGSGNFDIAVGFSIPIGATEENPINEDAYTNEHLHIQFGSGTFNPLVEFYYSLPLGKKWGLSIFSLNKIPFYENSKGYFAPFESTNGVSLAYSLTDWLTPRVTLAGFSQTQAEWDGQKDPNSGLNALNGAISASVQIGRALITPSVRLPIVQKSIANDGDTFDYGPTLSLDLSWRF